MVDTNVQELFKKVNHAAELIESFSSQKSQYEETIGELRSKIGFLEEKVAALNKMPGRPVVTDTGKVDFENAEAAAGFTNYFKAIMSNDRKAVEGMSEGVDADGGYLVPPQYASTILRLISVFGICRPMCTIIPMASNKLYFPNLSSGITPYWVDEGGVITKTKPAFGQIELVAKKLCALVPSTSELVADANVSIATLIATLVAEAFAQEEDRVILAGDVTGASDPFDGILFDSNVTVYTMPAGSTSFSNIHPDDLLKMTSEISEAGRRNGTYMMEPSVLHILMMVKASTAGTYIYNVSTREGAPGVAWGRPVRTSEEMPSVADASGDSTIAGNPFVIYGNFKNFYIGEREGLSIASSEHVYFTSDQVAWRFKRRVSYKVALPGSFVILQCSAV